jgi:TonB-dependent SusC/RagA subfamily outer membrane receptor
MKFIPVLFLLSTMIISAQEGTRRISGTVRAIDNQPLPGVTIKIKETTSGTTTDQSGNYVLNVEPSARTLVFSFIGMSPQEITIGNQTKIDVVLQESAVGLSEVVVVGYGTVKKSDITGSLTSVSEKTLSERPVQNVIQALQGKASGVDITSNIKPGELPPVTIRGNRSIQASNTPLYVVDGIPLAIGNLTDFNPNDISSVEILKDASATAIYGSRGANGVILISTKKGAVGKINVSYNATLSFDSYHSLTDWMNGGQYIDRQRLTLQHIRIQIHFWIIQNSVWQLIL